MEPQKIMLVTYRIFQYALLPLLPAVILISLSSCSANPYGNETDHLALLEFKSRIGDDPYGVLSSWNETRPHCEWRGVMCSQRHQRVTALELRKQSLSGSISPHIGNISFLRYIDLSSNNLNGEIPQEIGCLFQLSHLNLSKNTLGGAIPVNLSHCTEFKTLDLSYNEHTGQLPLDLGSLNKLVVLRLDHNNLSGEIPHSFGNLSSLEEMHMGYNKLQGSLRKELSKLTSLIFLQIGGNNLTGIMPPSMYNLSSINMFAIAENQLAGNLPTNIGSTLPNLELFYIDYNLFSGTIPASFGNASKLKEFDISRNAFVGKVPNNIGYLSGLQYINIGTNQLGSNSTQDLSFLVPLSNCSNLNTLSFFRNNIGGQIPNSIGNFSIHMGQLHMGYNQISGPIPEAFGSLTNLYFLGMDRNLLSGAIPSFIGRFQKLQRLLLNENQFSGEIPSSLGNLSQIEDLILNSNRLEGKIPESIGNCRKLQYLELADNNLHGIIPPQVIEIPFLLVIYLSTNSLSGPLPARVGKPISINYLGISANNLSGEIPMSIGDCLSLEYLDMEENSFSGSIPSSLSSLKGIQFLDLSQNNLSGKIPKVLESLVYLQYLNLSFNNLEGNVPTKNVFGNASAISAVGNSKLCGGIAKLELPPCPIPQVKKQNKISFASKLIIALVSLIFFLILVTSFGFLHWKRNKTKVLITSLEEGKFMKISYRELYKATDRFSSENAIGSGSFGSVYRGKLHHQADKLIAVKVLNLQNTRASKSFLAECKILRNVRHRNLVKLLTYCSSMDSERNDFKALVYEFMPNGNLDLWLHPDEANRSKTLTLVQRLEVAIDIASALEYLHCHCEAPIIHCDLKPSNILLDDDMGARVGDFGLARFCPKVTNDVSEISSIGIKGSIGYAAPEYGTGSEVSLKGDVYSYGIILLEMMTGRRPTDDFFKDGLDIHNYVQKAFPKQVNLIMDPVLGREQEIEPSKEEELGQNNDGIEEIGDHGGKVGSSSPRIKWKNCIMSILAIGLACSKESPAQRIDMNDVHMELYRIKGALLGCGRNRL